ncbi:MAG: hypothetical protein GY874_12445 [Desulfobacteraceae bacterium]|nr:hypothetical protein [Desulfobacteraceae bacterium]
MKKLNVLNLFVASSRDLGMQKFTIKEIASKMKKTDKINPSYLPKIFAKNIKKLEQSE